MKRFYWFLGGYFVFLLFAYIIFWQSTYSVARLSLSFSYNKKLDVTICNPTNHDMVFFNALQFGNTDDFLEGHLINIEYRTADGSEHVVRKADTSTIGGVYSIIDKSKLAANECLSKKGDIKPYLLNLEKKINAHQERLGLPGIDIVAFRVRVSVYKYYSPSFKIGTRAYQSDWFELSPS